MKPKGFWNIIIFCNKTLSKSIAVDSLNSIEHTKKSLLYCSSYLYSSLVIFKLYDNGHGIHHSKEKIETLLHNKLLIPIIHNLWLKSCATAYSIYAYKWNWTTELRKCNVKNNLFRRIVFLIMKYIISVLKISEILLF